ncbi:MAG: hypothetical protein OH319_02395 [Candidatus Parvarchaeota archaeon]|nr:hypothetical protein [Candidatus Jingweiarchaeum tengchongense]MCW1298218.1 hypothetical protein [Candidatus Jingweiarchaeum tengchongense]MCW1300016.1 hypothetical protein [Candidatus Jingweiarchaeum tengchongense]MCW1304845.1 hypothetical protein [Candidatus Jingweiarchaeum tengchongense]MCW1305435.1 hypothetical protein [Candidatus Jingweiarchaeum tengchongense]
MKNLVIAAPHVGTYTGLPREKIIIDYNKMAYDEFDKQFTPLLEPKIMEETIEIPRDFDLRDESCKIIHFLKRTMIDVEIARWQDKPVNASLLSLIYTSEDGYPYGEADYIRNLNKEIDIAKDLENFYKRFNWNVRSEMLHKDLKNISVKKLDEMLLPKLLEISKE